jgi:hypothetical protein
VDTDKAHLKEAASSLLGRYFIGLTRQAATEREGEHHRPAFLYVDEAHEYFDDNIEGMLAEVRQKRIGLILAHQHLGQLTPDLQASLLANAAVKLASGVSSRDAKLLAPDMRCDPEKLSHMQQFHFMCFVRDVTGEAIEVQVQPGRMENAPKSAVVRSTAHTYVAELPASPVAAEEATEAIEEPAQESDVDIVPVKDW